MSVFEDNAGVVRFDDEYDVCFKVETHNHPSAIEPYGGANTGLGGVIRDLLGTGLGAKPICNTDVFCFAPPDTPAEESAAQACCIPQARAQGRRRRRARLRQPHGHPDRQRRVCFDDRYLGNPLVFCGTVGLIPADMAEQSGRAGRPDRRRRRPHRPRRHPRRDVHLDRADRARAKTSPAAPCRSATPSPRRSCST